MLQRASAVLVCVTPENTSQVTVLLNSLSKHYTDRLILAYHEEVPAQIQDAVERGGWIVELCPFKMPVPEAGMVVKAIQRLFDSSYHRVLYLNSNTLVQGDISELLRVNIEDVPLAAAPEYEYREEANADRMYRSEDPTYNAKQNGFDGRYFNSDVMLINMSAIRRSQIDIDGLFDSFWHHRYQVELGLCEFLNVVFKEASVAVMPRNFNFKADRYLYNARPYHKLIRSSLAMAQASIANYRQAQPWTPGLKLDRLSFQVPMHRYQEETNEVAEHLPAEFVEAVNSNAEKWSQRLGKLPEAIDAYHR